MAIKTRQTDGTGVTNQDAALTNTELDTNFIELVAADATKQDILAEGAFADGDKTKLDGIATSATANPDAINNVVEDTTPQLGGDLASNGNDVLFADDDKAIFGAGSDLEIYHDGSNSYIKDTATGDLRIQANNLTLWNATANQYTATFTSGGAVTLYNAGDSKLATTATGVDVTGTVTSDGMTVEGDVFIGYTANVAGAPLQVNTAGTTTLGLSAWQNPSHLAFRRSNNATIGGNTTVADDDVIGKISFLGADGSNYEDAAFIQVAVDGTLGTDTTDMPARIEFATSADNSDSPTTHMTILSGGNVGIGETAPASPLTVKGSFGYASSASNLETSTTKSAVRIQGSNDASTSLWIGVDTTDAQPYLQVANGAGTGSDDLLINPFGGNVGIGTAAPLSPLDVEASDANQRVIRISHPTAPADAGGYFGFASDGTNDNGVVNLGVQYSSDYYDVINIQRSTRNVGIGTGSPTSGFKLEVIGDARFGDAVGDDAVELGWSSGGSQGFVQAYDRAASAFRPLSLNNAVTIDASGNVAVTGTVDGVDIATRDGILTTTTTTANAALPKAGGTMTGGINYDDYHETYAHDYVLNVNTPKALLWNGTTSTLQAGGCYRFTAHISGTSTDNSATAVYWNQNGTWKLNATCQSGTTSNHPRFVITNGIPTLAHSHATNYTVHVYGERMELKEAGGTDNYNMFGADGFLSSVASELRYNPAGDGTDYTNGDIVWTAGNDGADSGLDADTLDGIQAASFLRGDETDTFTTLIGASLVVGGDNPTSPGQIAIRSITNPYVTFHENATRRAYILYNATSHYLQFRNEESYAFLFQGNGNTQIDLADNAGSVIGKFGADGSNVYIRHGSNNEPIIYGQLNSKTYMYFNGLYKLNTEDNGISVNSEGTATAIRMHTTNGLLRGYVYANNSNEIGFLDAGGSWAYKIQNDASHIWYSNSSITRMTLTNSGNLTVTGEVTVNSDERIKDNIAVIPDALEKVKAIRGITYTRTDIEDTETVHVGVIAQEVEAVLPEAVRDGEGGIKSVAYGNMVGLLIEAMKEQQVQIDELKAQVTRLSGYEQWQQLIQGMAQLQLRRIFHRQM